MIGEDPYNICETYLLLRQVEGPMVAILVDDPDIMWEALNLETGAIDFITPFFTAGTWERLL